MAEGDGNNNVGVQLMTDLVRVIAQANNNAEVTRELLIEMRDVLAEQVTVQKVLTEKLDELCGRLEVVSVATDILAETGATNGSRGPTMKDFIQALSSAEREVFGDGDDDDDDDDGGGGDGGSPVEPEIISPTRRSR